MRYIVFVHRPISVASLIIYLHILYTSYQYKPYFSGYRYLNCNFFFLNNII